MVSEHEYITDGPRVWFPVKKCSKKELGPIYKEIWWLFLAFLCCFINKYKLLQIKFYYNKNKFSTKRNSLLDCVVMAIIKTCWINSEFKLWQCEVLVRIFVRIFLRDHTCRSFASNTHSPRWSNVWSRVWCLLLELQYTLRIPFPKLLWCVLHKTKIRFYRKIN